MSIVAIILTQKCGCIIVYSAQTTFIPQNVAPVSASMSVKAIASDKRNVHTVYEEKR